MNPPPAAWNRGCPVEWVGANGQPDPDPNDVYSLKSSLLYN